MEILTIPLLFLIFHPTYSSAYLCKLPCGIAPELKYIDPYALSSPNNLLKHSLSRDLSGNIQAVIEVPLQVELKNGRLMKKTAI